MLYVTVYIHNMLQYIYKILYVRVYIICYTCMVPGLKSAGSLSGRIKAKMKRKKYLKFKLLGKTIISPEAKKHLISPVLFGENIG